MLHAALAALLVLIAAAGLAVHTLGLPLDLTESGPVEIGQALVALVGAVVWGALALHLRAAAPAAPFHASIAIFFSLLCVAVAGREASWMEEYGSSEATSKLLEAVIGGAIALGALGLAAFWLTRRARAARIFRRFMAHPSFGWAILSFLLVLAGDIFEKRLFALDSNLLWEELLELLGFAAIAGAGLTGFARRRG
ncbi:hypothetical protein DDZ14_10065 [Maritimibacter sp. 55A14]|uniref:hypothetical protein n=1 Tax=Maritimibacter sp. 55A14 TaxID=2174844 RepID=UPI000D60C86A|nr:hypothetical protein [Maritimibacter sp. 55A14]PWE32404.1 hypothetical protein DDZ14_10065 [Maritimibacter sp. 55A14]